LVSLAAGGATRFRDAHVALGAAQKTSKGAPGYSLYVNRPLGRVLAAGADTIGLRPNQVTALSAAATFSGIVLVALLPLTVAGSFVISALLVLGYALDSADGQLARLQRCGSAAGEWLDHVADAIKLPALHLAVAISWHRNGDDLAWLVVPIVFQLVASVLFFVIILNDVMHRLHRQELAPASTAPPSLARSLAMMPTDYGALCVLFTIAWWHQGFRVAYTVMLVASAALLVFGMPRWFAAMKPERPRPTPGR
jgi:phosphatidylglycerophosphate synthase